MTFSNDNNEAAISMGGNPETSKYRKQLRKGNKEGLLEERSSNPAPFHIPYPSISKCWRK